MFLLFFITHVSNTFPQVRWSNTTFATALFESTPIARIAVLEVEIS